MIKLLYRMFGLEVIPIKHDLVIYLEKRSRTILMVKVLGYIAMSFSKLLFIKLIDFFYLVSIYTSS